MNASQEVLAAKLKKVQDSVFNASNHSRVFTETPNPYFSSQEDIVLKHKELCKQFGSTQESKEQLTTFLANQADMKHCIQEFLFDKKMHEAEVEKLAVTTCDSNFLMFTESLTMAQLYAHLGLQKNRSIGNFKSAQGISLLHIAVTPTVKKFSSEKMQEQHKVRQDLIIKLLIDNGCSKIAPDNDGNTPMHYAAMRAVDTTMYKIHTSNAMNIQNNGGNTPMHGLIQAIRKKNLDKQDALMIERLVFLGANLNIKNNKGDTPFSIASGTHALHDLLRNLGGKK